MDDAARRVNPAQLRALLRCRTIREDQAARAVQLACAGVQVAQSEHASAAAAAAEHQAGRHGREQALIGQVVGQVQHSRRVLTMQHAVERLAEEAVSLADAVVDAGHIVQQSGEALAVARALHARRARAVQKWRMTLDRVEAMQRGYADAQAETELDDEQSDRHARHRPFHDSPG